MNKDSLFVYGFVVTAMLFFGAVFITGVREEHAYNIKMAEIRLAIAQYESVE